MRNSFEEGATIYRATQADNCALAYAQSVSNVNVLPGLIGDDYFVTKFLTDARHRAYSPLPFLKTEPLNL